MVTDQEAFEVERKFNRFHNQGLCQVPVQKGHFVPCHQNPGHTHQIKFPAVFLGFPINCCFTGNPGDQVQ
jgi:hypothetical protein